MTNKSEENGCASEENKMNSNEKCRDSPDDEGFGVDEDIIEKMSDEEKIEYYDRKIEEIERKKVHLEKKKESIRRSIEYQSRCARSARK